MMAQAFGANLQADGVSFRLWAPDAKSVDLMLGPEPHAMPRDAHGWYETTIAGARAGTLYTYRIDGEREVPDPASHFQPRDVHGPSEVIDHAGFRWRNTQWRGRPWQEAVFLEIHVGAFTPAGTYWGVIDKLDHIVDTGVTAIELMPLADFPGRHNWGYDGVLLYAPDSTYGRPDDLRTLVDEAHARGLMVFLDVVYNHFGPEGNYLDRYASPFFTSAHTPWGRAIDYRVPEVRSFAIENALHWLRHYRFDGLRLDAVHAIVETGTPSMLEDLSRAVGDLAAASGRAIHLVLENDDNRARLLAPAVDPPDGRYRAQWNDDWHHAWHVLLTGEKTGYYGDYADDPRRRIARVVGSGFAYQGEPSAHREDRARGEPSGSLSPLAFVNFLQNHDQIGNRPRGERLTTQAPPASLEAALAVTLLSPMPPLMFMGEEWGSTRPFPFFCDFEGELADAVRKGRREEFKAAYAAFGAEIPDPLAEETFSAAILDWDARLEGAGKERLALVRKLLATRQREIVPHLAAATFGTACVDGTLLSANWHLDGGQQLALLANLSARPAPNPAGLKPGRILWGGVPTNELAPWTVFWSIGAG